MKSCFKQKAFRSQKYLNWIDKQPSLLPGYGDVTHHHVRIDGNAGTGMKPSDLFCLPLYVSAHNAFHTGQESDREFFERHNIDIYRELHRLTSLFIEKEI